MQICRDYLPALTCVSILVLLLVSGGGFTSAYKNVGFISAPSLLLSGERAQLYHIITALPHTVSKLGCRLATLNFKT